VNREIVYRIEDSHPTSDKSVVERVGRFASRPAGVTDDLMAQTESGPTHSRPCEDQMLLRLWSKATHKRLTIPFRGYYTCLTCLRRFKVAWEGTTERGGTQPQRNRAKPEG